MRISTAGRLNSFGFTFVEIIVLLAVIGVVCAAVLPRMGVMVTGDLDRATRRLIHAVRETRTRAQLDGTTWSLCIVPDMEEDFAVVDRTANRVSVAGDNVDSIARLPGGSPVTDTTVCLSFSPDGLADAAYIRLTSGEAHRTVHIKPFNPKPGVYDEHVM